MDLAWAPEAGCWFKASMDQQVWRDLFVFFLYNLLPISYLHISNKEGYLNIVVFVCKKREREKKSMHFLKHRRFYRSRCTWSVAWGEAANLTVKTHWLVTHKCTNKRLSVFCHNSHDIVPRHFVCVSVILNAMQRLYPVRKLNDGVSGRARILL